MENIFFKNIEKINSRLETTRRILANVKTIIKNTHCTGKQNKKLRKKWLTIFKMITVMHFSYGS